MLFTLEDINNLIIKNNNKRLDETCKYDIEYYERILKENTQIIIELAKFVYDRINLVQNMKLRGVLIYNLETELAHAYLETTKKKPREKFAKDKNIIPKEMHIPTGMLDQSLLTSIFVKEDLEIYARRIACRITEFMNEVYRRYKYAKEQQLPDQSIFYDIFLEAKKACSKLGVHCIKEKELREIIVEHDCSMLSDLKMDCQVKEDNSIEKDIGITSLPYTITLHCVNRYSVMSKKMGTYEIPATKSNPVVFYNKKYISSLNGEIEDDNKVRERRPDETDEEYIAYLANKFGKAK